jgi:hypothetical protein
MLARWTLIALACCALLAGCGGDDEPAATTDAATTPTETQPATETAQDTQTVTEPSTEPTTPTATGTSPEDVPGGAGDAEPARTLAQFTAKNGQIRPRVVRVPPFISIRVELRSQDGLGYALDFGGGKSLTTGPQVSSTSTEFPGLRLDQELIGRPVGSKGNVVRVVASAEPGP